MSERLVHQRTKGPASTPAQRLVELQQELLHTQQRLTEETGRATSAERRLLRYEELGHVSFGGIKAAQIWADFFLWEGLLNDQRFHAIIELGTWQAGFSWWLWAQTQARKQSFWTFDAIVPDNPPPGFTKLDVFAEVASITTIFRQVEPLVLFCDNGNKPREIQTFAPLLKHEDSLIVVHDWETEIGPDDIPDTVEMVAGSFCDDIRSMSRVFRLRRDDA